MTTALQCLKRRAESGVTRRRAKPHIPSIHVLHHISGARRMRALVPPNRTHYKALSVTNQNATGIACDLLQARHVSKENATQRLIARGQHGYFTRAFRLFT
jgi:hypothetical protein